MLSVGKLQFSSLLKGIRLSTWHLHYNLYKLINQKVGGAYTMDFSHIINEMRNFDYRALMWWTWISSSL